MRCYRKTLKGKRKKYLSEKTEIIENGKFFFAGLASCRDDFAHGQHGADLVLEEVYLFMKDHYEELSTEFMKERMQYDLGLKIREKLEQEALQSEIPLESLAYNFTGILMNKEEGTYVCVHLGDGEIYERNAEGKLRRISSGEYGPTRKHRIFITDDGSLNHIRFLKGEMKHVESIYFFSKGGDKIYKAMRRRSNHFIDPEKEEEMFVRGSMRWLNNQEDATVIKLCVSC